MEWDRLPASRRRSRVDRLLAEYVRDEVLPFSTTEPPRLAAAGLDLGRGDVAAALTRLPPVEVAEVDGIAAVLRPTAAALAASPQRWAWWWAGVTGRRGAYVEAHVDPVHRAIHFDDDGLLVASTAADLDRLGDLGRRWLERAGVRTDDAVVSVLPARAGLAFWQLTLGARRAGVPALHLGPDVTAADVVPYAPTVLAGTVPSLRGLAAGARPEDLGSVRVVLVTGWMGGDDRVDLAARIPSAVVRWAWAPAGVRALWAECRAGALHTWPETEVVEVLDPAGRPARDVGDVVWTPVGWRGTVVLRLRTGARARLVDTPCPCGATSPRLEAVRPPGDLDAPPPGSALERTLAATLAAEPLVADWSAEAAGPAGAHLVVLRLAPVRGGRAALEAELARLGELTGADRVVVERPSVLRHRLEAAGGTRVAVVAPA